MSDTKGQETAPAGNADGQRRTRWIVAPAIVFLAMALMFAFALRSGDPSKLPSALIGKPAPQVAFQPLEGLSEGGRAMPGFDGKDLADGQPTVVNFWASWCGPCVEEHPMLEAIRQRTGVRLVGINYKDTPANARRFLGRYGNPYAAVGVDPEGRGAIEWGVYGMPETFVVDGRGRIAYKHVGPISAESLQAKMLPAIKAVQAQAQAR